LKDLDSINVAIESLLGDFDNLIEKDQIDFVLNSIKEIFDHTYETLYIYYTKNSFKIDNETKRTEANLNKLLNITDKISKEYGCELYKAYMLGKIITLKTRLNYQSISDSELKEFMDLLKRIHSTRYIEVIRKPINKIQDLYIALSETLFKILLTYTIISLFKDNQSYLRENIESLIKEFTSENLIDNIKKLKMSEYHYSLITLATNYVPNYLDIYLRYAMINDIVGRNIKFTDTLSHELDKTVDLKIPIIKSKLLYRIAALLDEYTSIGAKLGKNIEKEVILDLAKKIVSNIPGKSIFSSLRNMISSDISRLQPYSPLVYFHISLVMKQLNEEKLYMKYLDKAFNEYSSALKELIFADGGLLESVKLDVDKIEWGIMYSSVLGAFLKKYILIFLKRAEDYVKENITKYKLFKRIIEEYGDLIKYVYETSKKEMKELKKYSTVLELNTSSYVISELYRGTSVDVILDNIESTVKEVIGLDHPYSVNIWAGAMDGITEGALLLNNLSLIDNAKEKLIDIYNKYIDKYLDISTDYARLSRDKYLYTLISSLITSARWRLINGEKISIDPYIKILDENLTKISDPGLYYKILLERKLLETLYKAVSHR